MLLIDVVIVLLFLIVGWQDYQTRIATNYITIPFFIIGIVYGLYQYALRPEMWYVFFAQIVITWVSLKGGMGGADWKMQCGLFGLNPLMGIATIFAEGFFGIYVVLTRGHKARFPKLSVMAIAVLSFFFITRI
jgi:Flp pilus assembly protein protease CpaA